nr:hypothetical protein [Tanacetum cinerariifolium]
MAQKESEQVTQTTTAEGGAITATISSLVTTEKKIKKKNDVKARSMLLMVLPNEHLMTFNQYKDAKSLFVAIEIRVGGNEATKKTQKTLLKQMYENFSATSIENEPDLDTMSIDDLYNNFKIVEQEVKETASSNSSSQNVAFVSSPSTNSINEVYTAYGVSTTSTQSSTANTQVSDTTGFDKSNVECYNCHKIGHFARECRGTRNQDSRNRYQDCSRRIVNVEETPPKATVAIDGVGFDWSYMAEDEVPTNMALVAFSDFEFGSYSPKSCEIVSKNANKDISNELKEYPDALLVKDRVSDNKDCSVESPVLVEKKTVISTIAKVEANCNYHQRKRVVTENNYTRVHSNNSIRKTHPSAYRNMAPKAVLMKTGLRPINTDRPVNTPHPKTTVYSARPMRFSKSAQSTVKRPYHQRTILPNKSFSQKVNTAKEKFYTARPRAVNTARPNSAVFNTIKGNQGHPQKLQEDQGYVDSRCSRHMTGNMSYLSDFKEFDEGYVTFKGGANGGRIIGKGTLKTGKLDFEDVYLVKELKFNLLSVSQMCNKKNNVLFTNTGCFVLYPEFKLADESQVTFDESMLWHRRLAHINFKNINKLVKDKVVRGLPSKRFENDQNYVACLKGKQHKASCKSKI